MYYILTWHSPVSSIPSRLFPIPNPFHITSWPQIWFEAVYFSRSSEVHAFIISHLEYCLVSQQMSCFHSCHPLIRSTHGSQADVLKVLSTTSRTPAWPPSIASDWPLNKSKVSSASEPCIFGLLLLSPASSFYHFLVPPLAFAHAASLALNISPALFPWFSLML